ncbi:hypothetical protein GLOIN_2v1484123 [Rhizophagus irregularis DAOM 181602=DAOM 197198]|uniref:Uncharacterized protein n=1 Tax=Rhizophagus irregularis (strain DAOM 181602 / DAOM 197198 / MUCL 43194) TaxID=747089 RepID=A0A2P4PFJ8_RHIID|nr:hypothetical protein GLOIN_2v1484123 [Rhizophagus irregularis DAOM 181602=DAOM 197198]POG64168.1 hypothetical protein GLOIN_2v1484123 [Rhizophagus irregularis DAOM 181602=DAOM 197198]|eukprot:XP_025171034.1 hypothetical protein GLOIN_2v1484123 [Rhizophagus irregularis DAOM 181602=DAOM 197198]
MDIQHQLKDAIGLCDEKIFRYIGGSDSKDDKIASDYVVEEVVDTQNKTFFCVMICLVYRKLHTGLNVVDTGIVKRSGDGNELPKTICAIHFDRIDYENYQKITII